MCIIPTYSMVSYICTLLSLQWNLTYNVMQWKRHTNEIKEMYNICGKYQNQSEQRLITSTSVREESGLLNSVDEVPCFLVVSIECRLLCYIREGHLSHLKFQ